MRYFANSDASLGMSAEPEVERQTSIDAMMLMDQIIEMRVALTNAFYLRPPVDSPAVQRIEHAVNHLTLWLYGRLAFTGLFLRTGRKAIRVLSGRKGADQAEQ